MCLAVPSRVINIDDLMATVEVYGARRDVSLMLMPEEVKEGDFVLVHAGFAIQKVEHAAAEDALRLIREMAELLQAEGDWSEKEEEEPEGRFP